VVVSGVVAVGAGAVEFEELLLHDSEIATIDNSSAVPAAFDARLRLRKPFMIRSEAIL
jgi:hypothetical protein